MDAKDFINKIKQAMKSGETFTHAVGSYGSFEITVSYDGSAVCKLEDREHSTLPAGSSPEEILNYYSTSIRQSSYSYDTEGGGSVTFVKDLQVGDVILYSLHGDENAKVISVDTTDSEIVVTFVAHSPGKTRKQVDTYPAGSMMEFDLLWGADWVPEEK